jgi:hypothetical protein
VAPLPEIPRETTVHLNKISAWALAGLLAAGSLAACSSTKKTDVSAGNSTTTAASSSGGGSTSGTSGGSGSGGSGSGGAITDAQCVSAALGFQKVIAATAGIAGGNTSGVSSIQSEYDSLGASIPDNLKSDYQKVGQAYAKFAQDIKGVSFSDPSSMAKLQQAASDLNNSDVKASADKIDAYFKNHCKS